MTFWLHRFRKLDVRQQNRRKMLIDTFVNTIYLYDDKMLIAFNDKDGTKTITFNEATTTLAKQNTGSTLDCPAAPAPRTQTSAGRSQLRAGAPLPAGFFTK